MEMAVDSPARVAAGALLTIEASPMMMEIHAAAESMRLEHQFLRVPVEYYKKTSRSHSRYAERGLSVAISVVDADADAAREVSGETAVAHLSSLVSRIQGLKRKLEEGITEVDLQDQRHHARFDHLDRVRAGNLSEWNNARVDRILVDYMLRMSYYETALKIADFSNIKDLVDIDVFLDAKKVIDSLQNKEVTQALAWCAENKARLKKYKSMFEFQLRLQEFIELVRADKCLLAIAYARKYLAALGATHMKELQRVMATLAFRSNTECEIYKTLFEPKQWGVLVEQFKQEFYRLFGMPLQPLLNLYLQAGLSVLKTPYCYEEGCTKEDPLSQESFRSLAEPLPFSKHHRSKLVCYITKEFMDSNNPPLVFPNGYVYSFKALRKMADDNNGKVTCPRTGEVCGFDDLFKAYIS